MTTTIQLGTDADVTAAPPIPPLLSHLIFVKALGLGDPLEHLVHPGDVLLREHHCEFTPVHLFVWIETRKLFS